MTVKQPTEHYFEFLSLKGDCTCSSESTLVKMTPCWKAHVAAYLYVFQTCFYFDVERDYFRKALDKFAHFFVSPLLLKDCVDREIQAVDSGM